MIKLGLKNYFKSYKYFFVPLGALSLGIVIGLSVMIPMLWGAVKEFVSGVAEVVGNTSFHWEDVKGAVLSSFEGLPWADLQAVADKVGTAEYWQELLRDCATVAFGDLSSAEAEITALAEKAMTTIVGGTVLCVFFTIVGALVGYYVTRSMIRNDVADRSFLKSILSTIIDTVINLTIIAAGVALIAKFNKFAIYSSLLTIIVYGAAAFLEAYFVHGYKKVPFKEVMQIKNFFLLALLMVIEVAIMAVLYSLLKVITNDLVALFAGFSVVVITFSCLQLNAEAYVKKMAEDLEVGKTEEKGSAVGDQGLSPNVLEGEEEPADKDERAESAPVTEIVADTASEKEEKC